MIEGNHAQSAGKSTGIQGKVGDMLLGKRSISVDEAMRRCALLDVCPQELMSSKDTSLHKKYWR